MLGQPPDHSDEPAEKTARLYMSIIKEMVNLKELKMRHYDIHEFNIGKQSVIQRRGNTGIYVVNLSSKTSQDWSSSTSVRMR